MNNKLAKAVFDLQIMYDKQYPKCGMGRLIPDGTLCIQDDKGNIFIPPQSETAETFIERLKRSKECGRNLFFEEWEPFEYEKGCLY